MLSKLGWNKGESLGKTQDSGGLLEPVRRFNFFPKYIHMSYKSMYL